MNSESNENRQSQLAKEDKIRSLLGFRDYYSTLVELGVSNEILINPSCQKILMGAITMLDEHRLPTFVQFEDGSIRLVTTNSNGEHIFLVNGGNITAVSYKPSQELSPTSRASKTITTVHVYHDKESDKIFETSSASSFSNIREGENIGIADSPTQQSALNTFFIEGMYNRQGIELQSGKYQFVTYTPIAVENVKSKDAFMYQLSVEKDNSLLPELYRGEGLRVTEDRGSIIIATVAHRTEDDLARIHLTRKGIAIDGTESKIFCQLGSNTSLANIDCRIVEQPDRIKSFSTDSDYDEYLNTYLQKHNIISEERLGLNKESSEITNTVIEKLEKAYESPVEIVAAK